MTVLKRNVWRKHLQVIKTPIKDLVVVELDVHGDERGFFMERFHEKKFAELGLPIHFPQDNYSRSGARVLRGLHCQNDPAMGKLVGVVRGKIWDVAVDLRPDSSTFGQHFGLELNDMDGKLFWIPEGFGHGFCVLGDGVADVFYKTTALYNPAGEFGVMWNDADLGIDWPISNPTISEKDKKQMSFAEYRKKCGL
jgi:dTDP-4-dehydrorhamnose 3,5-epimerase